MKKIQDGFLVSIEGIDGSGKSSLARNIHKKLLDYSCVLTKEPGGTPLGEKIRSILLQTDAVMCAKAEFLLFASSRAEHFEKLVIPALKNGSLVISDRMADSSLVYQGYARGLDIPTIDAVSTWAMNNVKPNVTFYLKLSVEKALERIKKRNIALTTFEQEEAFIHKTLDGFEELFKNRTDVVILDAIDSQELLADKAVEELSKRIGK
ncbi:MAG: dTMP kinase [Alteromonas naphthalenivorans]|jgi:dTMP kinase